MPCPVCGVQHKGVHAPPAPRRAVLQLCRERVERVGHLPGAGVVRVELNMCPEIRPCRLKSP